MLAEAEPCYLYSFLFSASASLIYLVVTIVLGCWWLVACTTFRSKCVVVVGCC